MSLSLRPNFHAEPSTCEQRTVSFDRPLSIENCSRSPGPADRVPWSGVVSVHHGSQWFSLGWRCVWAALSPPRRPRTGRLWSSLRASSTRWLREHAANVGAAFDRAVDLFQQGCAPDWPLVPFRDRHQREKTLMGLVTLRRDPWTRAGIVVICANRLGICCRSRQAKTERIFEATLSLESFVSTESSPLRVKYTRHRC